MKLLFVFFTAAVTAATPLHAQDAVQQSETGFFIQTAGGAPAICGFEFTIPYTDRTYLNGKLAGITGTLSWSESQGNVGVMLKMVGRDFPDPTKPGTRPFPVVQGFISIDGSALAPDMPIACEDRAGFCAIYGIPRSVQIFAALLRQKLTVSFARQAKGLDVTLPLDVQSALKNSPRDFDAFKDCMGAVVGRAEKNLGK